MKNSLVHTLQRTFLLLFLGSLLCTGSALASASAPPSRERSSFNSGWLFTRGDPQDAVGRVEYAVLKDWILATGTDLISAGLPKPVRPPHNPAAGVSYVTAGFNDSSWRKLNLPHDWAIEGPFAQELWGETGKLPYIGVGWYRKHFEIPASDEGRSIFLDIDGAMAFSAVWLNGKLIGGWPYGYTSFRLDLTPYLNFGGENVLSIRLNNPPESSRWYPGSGLYRNTWLVKTGPIRVRHWGTFVTTPRISKDEALVNVDVYVENHSGQKAAIGVTSRIFALDEKGVPIKPALAVAERKVIEFEPEKASEAMRSNLLHLPKPKLWDLNTPYRYTVETTLDNEGVQVDQVNTSFGVRSIHFDPDKGFLLNETPVKLQGVCLHHDLGALGAAINKRAMQRQIELLKSMGVNSIRVAHNPAAPEFLELCDQMGILVMNESLDAWRKGKKWPYALKENDPDNYNHDYARVFNDWHERDMRAVVRRDRNHPSVIMWSVGNEVIEQWYSNGWQLATRMASIVREEDRTRPTTAAFNGSKSGYNGFQTALDIIGFNYQYKEYVPFHSNNPTMPFFGSETAAMISSRGEYFFPVTDKPDDARVNFQVSSYDTSTEWFFNLPDLEFKALDEAPYSMGEYVWTGFDYLGEPTPYNSDQSHLLNVSDPAKKAALEKELAELGHIKVPSRSSYFGILDLAGFPKDRFYLYQARWRPDLPMAHILPHWNWPERVGEVTPVRVYTSGDEVELFLNGKSLGKKRLAHGQYRFCWDEVRYEPGELKAVVTKKGAAWAKAVVKTTGAPEKLLLTPDRSLIAADGLDLSYVTVTIADKEGLLVPRSKNLLHFTIEGPGELVATDNGDATSHTSFQSPDKEAFNGLALAIIRATPGQKGVIKLKVSSEGLPDVTCLIQSQ